MAIIERGSGLRPLLPIAYGVCDIPMLFIGIGHRLWSLRHPDADCSGFIGVYRD